MRACQPGPVALNLAIVAGFNIKVTRVFPEEGRPGLRGLLDLRSSSSFRNSAILLAASRLDFGWLLVMWAMSRPKRYECQIHHQRHALQATSPPPTRHR